MKCKTVFRNFVNAAVLMLSLQSFAFAQNDILNELAGEKKTEQAGQNKASNAERSEQQPSSTEKEGNDASAQKPAITPEAENPIEKGGDESEANEDAPDNATVDKKNALAEFLDSGALGLLISGGIFMWPILFIGILAVGVIIERYRSLRLLKTDDRKVCEEIQQLLFDDKIEEALELCASQQGPVPAVLSAGLRKYYVMQKLGYDAARTEEQVVKAMDDYSVHIVAGLERHLPVLATVSSAAPMLGFLGTVQGMIVAFQQIVEQMGETNIVEAAANGIQVSLLTTCFGLIVGIPAFVAFNYFTSVINRFVLQVEQSATELIENVSIQLAATGMQTGTENES